MKNFTISILFVFSGFFLTQIVPISPFHISLVTGIYLFLLIMIKKQSLIKECLIVQVMLTSIYFFGEQLLVEGDLKVTISILYSLIYLPIGIILLYKENYFNILKISNRFINWSLMLLIIECFYRLSNPNSSYISAVKAQGNSQYIFYAYKFNSIMYNDSNFVAIFILCVFFFTLYLNKYHNVKYRFQLASLFILCILTLGRASITSLVFCLLLFQIIDKMKKYRINYLIVSMFIIMVIIGGIVLGYFSFSQDSSFISKFQILYLAFKNVNSWGVKDLLLGVGFNNAPKILNISAHNFLLVYFFESGVIGLSLILFLIYVITIKTNYRGLYIILPFLISGMSFAPYAIPYFYAILGAIYVLENRKGIK
ncbi:hypothetical protein [Crassaminicella indica]|uniref:O-antigen ligase like membrane protein n=1 Tax=Crassaminicella indica TaxID=2855394 RepID=A0ABX8RIE2_9CLOT|nr:hypothetical protein [Crassaminicella indica]QXM06681.1 hypothetical protein KVH43_02875 [Crassaminicella indica]